jgi:single-strand DNA-binding protein
MPSYNSCTFIGRLGKDPDFQFTNLGKALVKFYIAVDTGKLEPMWMNVTAWEKTAEIVEKYASKGMLVLVSGRLEIGEYQDKNGAKRTSVSLVCTTFQMLEKKDTEKKQPVLSPSDDNFLDSDRFLDL